MKKISLIALSIVSGLISLESFAATSATLELSGSVAPSIEIDIKGVGASDVGGPSLSASLGELALGVSESTVGSIGVKSNSSSGFQLTATNPTATLSLANGANSIPYDLSIDSVAVALSTPITIPSTENSIDGADVRHPVSVSVPAPTAMMPSGTYSDTVTFTIEVAP